MKQHRICILTQPLTNGYGGLLQAYALQQVLRREGHIVYHEDRQHNSTKSERIVKNLKAILAPLYGPFLTPFTHVHYSSNRTTRRINKQTDYFKFKYLNLTKPVYTNSKKELDKYGFDTFIVGSDQVWRPRYSFGEGSIYNYFLDFTQHLSVTRIAYAASFGVPYWEFTDDETEKCGNLLKQFDAVSVREDSGVAQCKDKFNVEAYHVLDPTLLLDKEDYIKIVEDESEPSHEDNLFCYFLDPNPEKEEIVNLIEESKKFIAFSIMPTEYYYNVGKKQIDKCTYRSVTSWLRAFMDAKFIVTDSFHGTVFSIIFNKPFITIGNKDRGISRFQSLLKMFGLENRLVFDKSEITNQLLASNIDFENVNSIKERQKNMSLQFLMSALNI